MSRPGRRSLIVSPRESGVQRVTQFKVHAPRNPSDPDDFARFVTNLNAQLGLIADRFAKLVPNTITPSDYVRKDELTDLITDQNRADDQLLTSEGDDEVGTKTKKKNSRGRRYADEAAEAVIQNAQPVSALPNVAVASSIGTTLNPTLFSLADHTHGGVGASGGFGTAKQVAVWAGSNDIAGYAGFTWDNSILTLTAAGRILTNPLSKIIAIPQRGWETKIRPVAGQYGDATNVAKITVDGNGRVTNVVNVGISGVAIEFRRHFLLMGA